jgi:hypothetical protein
VTVTFDQAEPRLVHDILFEQGEHLAAGAPLAPLSPEDDELLASFFRTVGVALGFPDRTS